MIEKTFGNTIKMYSNLLIKHVTNLQPMMATTKMVCKIFIENDARNQL